MSSASTLRPDWRSFTLRRPAITVGRRGRQRRPQANQWCRKIAPVRADLCTDSKLPSNDMSRPPYLLHSLRLGMRRYARDDVEALRAAFADRYGAKIYGVNDDAKYQSDI